MQKPTFSDIAVFAADIAEVSDIPSVTTDVLEWIFTHQPFPELPPRLQSLICRQGPDPFVETWSADPDHFATRFIWPGVGIISHIQLRTTKFHPQSPVIQWEDRA